MNTDLRKAARDDFEKDFFKLIDNAVFGKTMENTNEKTQILVNKRVYLGFSVLEMSKTVIGEFWCDYVKPKYHEKAILCYTDTGSFVAYIKTNDIYKDIAEDVERNFDTAAQTTLKGKKKKVIDVIKDELGGKIMQ